MKKPQSKRAAANGHQPQAKHTERTYSILIAFSAYATSARGIFDYPLTAVTIPLRDTTFTCHTRCGDGQISCLLPLSVLKIKRLWTFTVPPLCRSFLLQKLPYIRKKVPKTESPIEHALVRIAAAARSHAYVIGRMQRQAFCSSRDRQGSGTAANPMPASSTCSHGHEICIDRCVAVRCHGNVAQMRWCTAFPTSQEEASLCPIPPFQPPRLSATLRSAAAFFFPAQL